MTRAMLQAQKNEWNFLVAAFIQMKEIFICLKMKF